MKRLFKKAVKKSLHAVGWDLCRRHQKHRISIPGVLEQARGTGFTPRTIIDVGVNYGTSGLYQTFNNAKYILVDPLEESKPFMEKICSELVDSTYFLAAASASQSTLTFNVHPDFGSSSLYKEQDGADGTEHQVKGITLDQICQETGALGPYLIKVDTQGSELDVMEGAQRIWPETEFVILEVSLFAFLKGGPQLYDVVTYMKRRGFVTYDIFGHAYRQLDDSLGQIDMVFVKEDGMFRKHHIFRTAKDRQTRTQEKLRLRRIVEKDMQKNRSILQF